MPRSRRQRSVIVLLLTACLLLQQLAMSALACTMPLARSEASMSLSAQSAMAPDCLAAMAGEHPAAATDALCEKHCAPEATSASTPGIPPVPALTLPPLLHALALLPAPHNRDYGCDAVFARSDPPTRLRYCRLLI